MEEGSTRDINLDLEPKDKSKVETDLSHVLLRQKQATESEEVKFPFNHNTDSLALLSVNRYARRIREFLGWESFRGSAKDLSSSENLSTKEKSNASQEEVLALSKEQKIDNCNQEQENSALENLLLTEVTLSNGNEDKKLSFPLEYDINNYKEKCKENNKNSHENYKNICDNNNVQSKRNSCYLIIENFSDNTLENENEFLSKSSADENENSESTSDENFHNNKCPKEVFRTESKLDVENLKTVKVVLFLSSNSSDYSLNSNKNTDMDKNLLEDNETVDAGLLLNDEDSITQNEDTKHFEDDKQLQNFISEDDISKDTNISHQKVEQEYILGNNDPSEHKSKNCFNTKRNHTEVTEISFNEDLSIETEQKENKQEKLEAQNSDLPQNINGLELFKASNPTDNCKVLSNNLKENSGKNLTTSKISIPLKAYIQCENENNKETLSKEIKNSEKQKLDDDEDTVCGVGFFRPRWLQPFATVKVYVILYSIVGILHGSYYTYLIGTLSTLEKRFAFKSKVGGVIMIADEITPLLLGMVIGYYANNANRPRIVALGMILSAGCCFASSLPYFIYGSTKNVVLNAIVSNTGPEYCDSSTGIEMCDQDRPQNLLAVLLLIFGSSLKGFGNLAYYSIGLAYLDDNSEKKSTPIYLAIALALRLLGPLVGFLMSSGFLKYYENPLYEPDFGPDDPRWIGAWWIGFFLQGVLLMIFTIPLAFFPRRLPSQKKIPKVADTASEEGIKELFKGLISALKRLGRNPVFIVLIFKTTMTIFGHFGHAIMLPKYMENQFRLSASEASLFSGALTILCIIISTLLGGFLIWKFRPRIKVLLSGMIVSEIILCVGFLILMIPRCNPSEMLHFGMNEEGLILSSVCNKKCDCSTSAFTPFCGQDGKTLYFSPCYAGCTDDVTSSSTFKINKEFSNCSCVPQQQLGTSISEGFCPDENCWTQTTAYLVVLFFMVSISNLFTVAATMILLRSVHPSDKSVALGTFETFICLLGFIPFPVTYGALVDSSCLVWEKSCGETGNCWFYDMERYNYLLHGASAVFCSLSVVCLITLYFWSSRIRNLYDEEDEDEEIKHVDDKLDTFYGSVTKL